jgi:hypothetical protein
MPGDPAECRRHARNCADLAERAKSPEAKDRFTSLAAAWEKLAFELEATLPFTTVLLEDDPIEPNAGLNPVVTKSTSETNEGDGSEPSA